MHTRPIHLALASALAAATALATAACGTGDPGTPGTTPTASPTATAPTEGRLLPLAVGATWTYRVTDPATGEVADKSNTVEALENVGGEKDGIQAYRVRTEKLNGVTVSWQEDLGNAIVRHREQAFRADGSMKTEDWYLPGKLRVDESETHLEPGATWTETYSERVIDGDDGTITMVEKSETWTVEAVDEEVTVPAGTFRCVRLRRVGDSDGASVKTWWFAPGVGKVKETGGQTEELVDWVLP